jgi:hypothetical protein
MRVYNKTIKYSFFQKDDKMDFVTFVTLINLIRLFGKNNFFNHGMLSMVDISQLSVDLPFYSLLLNNKFTFLKNIIFYSNIAKGMKVHDTNFLLDYKKKVFPAFTPFDSNEFKFDIEHTYLLYR